eukprot:15440297-Alexandrium_andersonii.AAC.2
MVGAREERAGWWNEGAGVGVERAGKQGQPMTGVLWGKNGRVGGLVCVRTCACACARVCARAFACACARVRTCVRAFVAWLRAPCLMPRASRALASIPFLRSCPQSREKACARACVSACTCACGVRVCVYVCVRARARACVLDGLRAPC